MSVTGWIDFVTHSMGCVCAKESVHVDGNRFFIRRRLGEGGFSYVDLVEDRNRKPFALKRIACHSREDTDIALKEVEYMRELDHPNLVSVEAAASVPCHDRARSVINEVLIVMPYYRRGTLFNELEVLQARGEQMREGRLLRVFHWICQGIKALHSATPTPLAHRDMKPHNVLMSEDDTPVIMDFGSMGPARLDIKGTSDAMALQDLAAERCSMPYRPPELFNVESFCTIDERVDIWSLGCTLYAMCFYESPFDQAYQRGDSIALAVLADSIKFPDNHSFSTDLTDLIQSMLVVNILERPFIDWVIQRVQALQGKTENRI